ncbi:hypothetical protein C5E07_10530 [Pseudoclavibacter sp. RFBJ3]|uniref:hypothetical protein n=1 Tax=unclassified Pseudoclavibacter TaxID=2615177 RepID=UPI000CE7D312|nr:MULTISPECIES: hypothetical protein [unclassified Pseudoclavibacter]PPF74896.1 hypothetical protein C5B99_12155 [Pseudoclavibacter sp. Z016]PPF83911.1 hypothetical protein C5C12_09610 [Pseudoclavibacter sp. RFBJ5]PPF92191.1 hypothetical protein C5E07_10530 [Pseudoclavibacter sp. RFBJ3]PPF97054.1 hypothetical protein C5C19_13840 [Pseudoclavibacter sp. RFBH5]PPG23741.1 hypothetical protein C5E13_09225 [Pseudoclavibacter sp. RFBI4]
MKVDQRVHVRDFRPFAVVDDLCELRGPASGVVTLSHAIYWGPNRDFDIGDNNRAADAYTAILNEGTRTDVIELMNAHRLERVWSVLTLPWRVLDEWQTRHPVLHQDDAELLVRLAAFAAVPSA